MVKLPLIDREPTSTEIEKLRLILSTYQDGSGMLINKTGTTPTIPGWRDFERAVALAFNGVALESKHVYDVRLHNKDDGLYYGISCKSRKELRQVQKTGRVTIELSNASGEFWDLLDESGINRANQHLYAKEIGTALIELVEKWHYQVDVSNGGKFNSKESVFLVLQYDEIRLDYALFIFPLKFKDPNLISWSVEGRHLIGTDHGEKLWEWYGLSGGQLKYYPHFTTALWFTEPFKLEPLPENQGDTMLNKVKSYFPRQWARIEQEERE